MATIDLADLSEILLYNNIIGYHAEGEELNYELLNRNASKVDQNSTFELNRDDPTILKKDSEIPVGNQ